MAQARWSRRQRCWQARRPEIATGAFRTAFGKAWVLIPVLIRVGEPVGKCGVENAGWAGSGPPATQKLPKPSGLVFQPDTKAQERLMWAQREEREEGPQTRLSNVRP
jgi:hypothetical protein